MKPQPFAKLFEYDDFGQVLVVLDTNDEGDPCISFMVSDPEIGRVTVSPAYQGPDAEASARRHFEATDAEIAYEVISGIVEMLPGLAGGA